MRLLCDHPFRYEQCFNELDDQAWKICDFLSHSLSHDGPSVWGCSEYIKWRIRHIRHFYDPNNLSLALYFPINAGWIIEGNTNIYSSPLTRPKWILSSIHLAVTMWNGVKEWLCLNVRMLLGVIQWLLLSYALWAFYMQSVRLLSLCLSNWLSCCIITGKCTSKSYQIDYVIIEIVSIVTINGYLLKKYNLLLSEYGCYRFLKSRIISKFFLSWFRNSKHRTLTWAGPLNYKWNI